MTHLVIPEAPTALSGMGRQPSNPARTAPRDDPGHGFNHASHRPSPGSASRLSARRGHRAHRPGSPLRFGRDDKRVGSPFHRARDENGLSRFDVEAPSRLRQSGPTSGEGPP